MDDIIEIGSEMGLTYEDFLDMTWKEFDFYNIGFSKKIQRNWDYVRNIIATQYNSSGFSNKKVKPKDIIQLDMFDKIIEFKLMDPELLEKMKRM